MINKILAAGLVFFLLLTPTYSQEKKDKKASSPPPAADGSKVDGLELPPDQTVGNDEGFVTIQAKTTGQVKWLVISAVKIKYVAVPDNSIIVSVPPQGGLITVFAVASVDGKITDFARTNITVAGGSPDPGPGPGPGPAGGMHVTFFVDINSTTAEIAAILNSQKIRQAVTGKGNFFRYFDIKSPVVAQKKLDATLQRIGGNFAVIVQRADGTVTLAQQMPRNEQDVLLLLQKVGAAQ